MLPLCFLAAKSCTPLSILSSHFPLTSLLWPIKPLLPLSHFLHHPTFLHPIYHYPIFRSLPRRPFIRFVHRGFSISGPNFTFVIVLLPFFLIWVLFLIHVFARLLMDMDMPFFGRQVFVVDWSLTLETCSCLFFLFPLEIAWIYVELMWTGLDFVSESFFLNWFPLFLILPFAVMIRRFVFISLFGIWLLTYMFS